MQTAEK